MNVNIISFAIKAHHNTNHLYDGNPYSVHLALVVYYAQKYINLIPEQDRNDVISACWLHDTIEDTRNTYNDILKISNEVIADIVYAVTNEKGKNRKERANEKYYEGIKNQKYASFVKLCDRLANVSYSKQNNSSMFITYKNENNHFIGSILNLDDHIKYIDMVYELENMLIILK